MGVHMLLLDSKVFSFTPNFIFVVGLTISSIQAFSSQVNLRYVLCDQFVCERYVSLHLQSRAY